MYKLAAVATLATINVKEAEDFVNGLLTGLVQDDNLDHVKACLKDSEAVEADIKIAVADFQKGDIAGIIAGAKEMGELLKVVEADITDCKGMKDDAERIKAWSAIFNNPSQLF